MTESDAQPWAPEGADRVGRGPTHEQDGERGTSAFTGSEDYNADGTQADPDEPERGPRSGTSYHEGSDLGTHAGSDVGREEATRGES